MTNNEIRLSEAIEALKSGNLTTYEAAFIERIRDYDKKQLRTLTSAQVKLLMQCAKKA